MMEMDLEDYIEEVKFQMVDAYDDVLDKEMILAWEAGVRKWVNEAAASKKVKHAKSKGRSGKSARDASGAFMALRFCSEDEIYVRIKNEEVCEHAAKKYYQAVTENSLESYWQNFRIV